MGGDLREQGSGQSLEEQSNGHGEAGQVATEARAQSQKTGEQGADGEEQRDQVKCEHEPREVEVHVGSNELLRHAVGGAKVARRVKRQRRNDVSAVRVEAGAGIAAADGEESPSRGVARVVDATGRGLQEVELVQRRRVDGAGQDGEELHHDSSGDQEESGEAENGLCEELH
jgi:hypothetical protein